MKPVRIDAEAEVELAESALFYQRRQRGLGNAFEREAYAAVTAIGEAPTQHHLGKLGTRGLALRRFPFVVHYIELADEIWILAFAHTSRRPEYWKHRLQRLD